MRRPAAALIVGAILAGLASPALADSDLSGRILLASGLPVPGAAVTITGADRTESTASDTDGTFRFVGLADGPWMLQVQMRGFLDARRDLKLPAQGPISISLVMRSYEEIVDPLAKGTPATPDVRADDTAPIDIINGSVVNGAATPFAQSRAFGNNRLRAAPRITGWSTRSSVTPPGMRARTPSPQRPRRRRLRTPRSASRSGVPCGFLDSCTTVPRCCSASSTIEPIPSRRRSG